MNKKLSLLIFCAVVLTYCSPSKEAQTNTKNDIPQEDYFSGRIIYTYQFLNPETREDITSEMSDTFGKEQHYYTDGTNYKSFDENGKLGQLFIGSTNKYYFPNPQTGQLMVLDASFDMNNNYRIEHTTEKKGILGYNTQNVIVTNNDSKTTYWYSDRLKVDTDIFKNHNLGGWNKFLNASKGSLALKFVVENENYIWITTAKEVKQQSFEEGFFSIEGLVD